MTDKNGILSVIPFSQYSPRYKYGIFGSAMSNTEE